MNIFKIKPIFLSNLFWCKTVVQYNYNKIYTEQNRKISPKERPSARSARRVGAPAVQASPRPNNVLKKKLLGKTFGPNTV